MNILNTLRRSLRHARITWKNYQHFPSLPFFILFINSICNMKCEHYFYWQNLRNDLTKGEIFALPIPLAKLRT
jgi:AdoMet-dependent heme synthase